MSKVNLTDLAKALNLSVSSVSKALRDSYEIGEETKNGIIFSISYAKSLYDRNYIESITKSYIIFSPKYVV
jgi:LacI family transcriptional regulator